MKNKNTKNTRRYRIDQWHPYGWQINFSQFVAGKKMTFVGIGVDRAAAIGNAQKGRIA
jgi:hypothetical protein